MESGFSIDAIHLSEICRTIITFVVSAKLVKELDHSLLHLQVNAEVYAFIQKSVHIMSDIIVR